MDLGILSKQLERLPASGLTLELKHSVFFHQRNKDNSFGVALFLTVIYIIFFLFVFISLFLFAIQIWQSMVLALMSLLYGQSLLRKHLLLNHPESIKKIVFTELGWCYVQLNDSKIFKADIKRNTIITEHLVILNIVEQPNQASVKLSIWSKLRMLIYSSQHSIFLTRDRLGDSLFRVIKCHLRFISFVKLPEKKILEPKLPL